MRWYTVIYYCEEKFSIPLPKKLLLSLNTDHLMYQYNIINLEYEVQ